MNLSLLPNNYQFLYSPKSWLHVRKRNYKVFCFFLQLFILPYIHLKYIVIIFTITLLFLRSVNLPTKVQKNLCMTSGFLLLTLVISIYYTTKSIKYHNINNYIIKVQPLGFIYRFFPKEVYLIKKLIHIQLYILGSICRLIMISLTYLFTIKILLLTTNYEEIIISLLSYTNNLNFIQKSQIPFIVTMSSQFLKTIFVQIDTLKIAYLIRGTKFEKYKNTRKSILIHFFLIRSFFIHFYINTQFIAKTLHSRDIANYNLHVVNTYNK